MCSNQLSYVAIFFSRYLIGVAGRIMRIEPNTVNTFFNEIHWNVTVWLGCEQPGAIFGNYWSFRVINEYDTSNKKAPMYHRGLKTKVTYRLTDMQTGGHLPRVLKDRPWF